jgi:predicted DNA-binding ribbon-helix-helix protein
MQSAVKKRSILIDSHKTSISLEDAFWLALRDIAQVRKVSVSNIISQINKVRNDANLSSAVRLFVLDHYRSKTEPRSMRAAA